MVAGWSATWKEDAGRPVHRQLDGDCVPDTDGNRERSDVLAIITPQHIAHLMPDAIDVWRAWCFTGVLFHMIKGDSERFRFWVIVTVVSVPAGDGVLFVMRLLGLPPPLLSPKIQRTLEARAVWGANDHPVKGPPSRAEPTCVAPVSLKFALQYLVCQFSGPIECHVKPYL